MDACRTTEINAAHLRLTRLAATGLDRGRAAAARRSVADTAKYAAPISCAIAAPRR